MENVMAKPNVWSGLLFASSRSRAKINNILIASSPVRPLSIKPGERSLLTSVCKLLLHKLMLPSAELSKYTKASHTNRVVVLNNPFSESISSITRRWLFTPCWQRLIEGGVRATWEYHRGRRCPQ